VYPAGSVSNVGFTIDRIDYRITCAGNPPGTYPIPDADTSGTDYPYDDSVDMSGAFEIVDTGTPPVWQAAVDLPPGDCTMTMTVWDGDEIVCLGTETLAIVEDESTKFDIILVCLLSTDTPEGQAELEEGAGSSSLFRAFGVGGGGLTWDFVQGNACPQLVWLGADPTVLGPVVPAVTNVQTYSYDPDNACGENCDPQTCDRSTNPPVCTPGPETGLISTWYAPSGVGTFADANAFDTTYTCDPLFPGATDICALVSDGDVECERTRCLTIVCP